MLRESGLGEATLLFDSKLAAPHFSHNAFFTNDVCILKSRIKTVSHYIVCIGGEHGYARCKTAECLERLGLKPITLIHGRSFIDSTASISVGCQIMPSVTIHKFTTIGKHTITNTNATVDHECIIGDGVHIMGSAAITGKVEIGNYATVGTNATLLPSIKVGEGAYIGAGAVVTKNVDPYTVVMGVPARKQREHTLNFEREELEYLLS